MTVSLPSVTRDLLGNTNACIGVGGNLQVLIPDVANRIRSGEATQDLSDSVQSLLGNGVVPTDLNSVGQGIAGALSEIGQVANVGAIPRFFLNVGAGVLSGACVAGPYGAALGAVTGAIASLPALFAGGPRFNAPSSAENEVLHRLRIWTNAHPATAEPVGWHLYDFAAMHFQTATILSPTMVNPIVPVCTPFLYGEDPGPCNDLGSFSAPPAGSDSEDLAQAEIATSFSGSPDQIGSYVQDILGRLPDPYFYAIAHPDNASHPATTIPDPQGNYTAISYGWCFMLGTVFAMLASGASDQSIAAELVLQQSLLDGSGDHPGALYVQPLVDLFLSRLPSAAEYGAKFGPIGPQSFQGGISQRLVHGTVIEQTAQVLHTYSGAQAVMMRGVLLNMTSAIAIVQAERSQAMKFGTPNLALLSTKGTGNLLGIGVGALLGFFVLGPLGALLGGGAGYFFTKGSSG